MDKQTPTVRDEVSRDGLLVKACLAGSQQAWTQLYCETQPRLCEAIGFMLRRVGQHNHLTDEIAARVWFALIRDSGRLLMRFDSERDCRFGVFLVGLARNEIMRYFRSERRRMRREKIGGRVRGAIASYTEAEMDRLMRDFATTLTPRERDFLQRCLKNDDTPNACEPDTLEMSDTNVWQHRSRLRRKLESFFSSD